MIDQWNLQLSNVKRYISSLVFAPSLDFVPSLVFAPSLDFTPSLVLAPLQFCPPHYFCPLFSFCPLFRFVPSLDFAPSSVDMIEVNVGLLSAPVPVSVIPLYNDSSISCSFAMKFHLKNLYDYYNIIVKSQGHQVTLLSSVGYLIHCEYHLFVSSGTLHG